MNKKNLLLFLLFVGVTLSAEVDDKWKINIGAMYVTDFQTELQLSHKGAPVSAKVNTVDQLGMEYDTASIKIDGYYRFNNRHSLDMSYFSVNSEGHKSITENIGWDDKTIEAGASIDSYFNIDVYRLSYAYSFYHNKDVELALTAGLHITAMDIGISAEGTITDNETATTGTSYSDRKGMTLPLPVFGFKGQYTIIDDRLFVNYKAEYFFLTLSEYSGKIVNSSLNLEYRFVDHVGVGLGYDSSKIFVEYDNGEQVLEAANYLSGVVFYMTYTY